MDMRPHYITMCEQAVEEIQKKFHSGFNQSGSYVHNKAREKTVVLYYNRHHGDPPEHYLDVPEQSIWLPRAYDIITLSELDPIDFLFRMSQFFFEHGGYQQSFEEGALDSASVEQLFLLFYMYRWHNKIWWHGQEWKVLKPTEEEPMSITTPKSVANCCIGHHKMALFKDPVMDLYHTKECIESEIEWLKKYKKPWEPWNPLINEMTIMMRVDSLKGALK